MTDISTTLAAVAASSDRAIAMDAALVARDLANDLAVIDDQTGFRHQINSDPREYRHANGKTYAAR